jgi:ABC-type lipoprotein export system ATPase subunit
VDRGSLWRRWDLHVHTPESALANHYNDWESYLTALETKGVDVAVLGVTDYCSIEGYKRALQARANGRLRNFDLILPNIEFRTHPELPDGRAINLHILVDPTANDHVGHIERCLGLLTFRYGEIDYPCRTADLVALGRAVDSKQADDWGAFKTGVNAFKPGFEDVRTWLEKGGRWLRKNGLVVIANGKDSPSGLSKDAGFAAVREELYRCADMVFSANPKDRMYFLGQGSDEPHKVIEKNGSLKPCIHGSDAHSEGKLFQPEKDRYCWIKADPTFEGLRQLVHEPADRVFIGPTPPSPSDASKVIDKVKLEGASDWFSVEDIVLNDGLVTVIGEKGSGKTALAELIAFATSSWKSGGMPASFISKASSSIDNLTVKVTWMDGHISRRRIGDGAARGLPEIRYLSQDFVEELCSKDLSGRQLIREIEDVVFGYIDEADRLDASDFAGLRLLRTEHIGVKKRDVSAKISSLNREIIEIERRLAGRGEKQQLLERAKADATAIDAQLPALQSTVDPAVAGEIAGLTAQRQVTSSALASAKRSIARIGTARAKTQAYVSDIIRQFEELRPQLVEVGLSDVEADAFRPNIPDTAWAPFEPLSASAEAQITKLTGDSTAPSPTGVALADLDDRLQRLRERLATDEQQRIRLNELQEQRSKIEANIRRLENELKALDTTVTASLATKKEERWTRYLSYFDLLEEERTALAGLYAPLEQVIAEDSSGTKAGFQLDVRLSAAPSGWIDVGREMFDKRRSGVALTDRALLNELERTLFEHWQSGDQGKIREALDKLLNAMGSPENIDQQLLGHACRERVYDWLFSTDHINLDYGLKYKGTDLDRLSPGTRGIVLLVLYLAMDRQDRRPLIIDQPEGNLDNSSVYEALVPFLRKAKHSRQVILVSHNPNLVVTTDADQVIVAKADRPEGARHPIISYSGGALENAGTEEAVRAQTIKLLEGGKDPFRMRESKYAIQ